MTTGRINQVTILNLGAEARGCGPREGGKYEGRSRQSDPSQPHRRRTWRRRCERLIQLPPLSSPRCGPQRNKIGDSTKNKPVACAPQEEETHASSRKKLRLLGRAAPKDLVNFWQCQQSTDPKMVPVEQINRTSVASRKFGRNTGGIASKYGHIPTQTSDKAVAESPENVQAQYAYRNLGNRACKYDTRKGNGGGPGKSASLNAPSRSYTTDQLPKNPKINAQRLAARD